ncbi:hypothetical protein MLD52_12325 [Puniceicoccaceae bacterium K14]|nr:hypothetical protein [Puniceicoccaceae bacterium K14]
MNSRTTRQIIAESNPSLLTIEKHLSEQKAKLKQIQSRLGTANEQAEDMQRANDLAHDVINITLMRNLKLA